MAEKKKELQMVLNKATMNQMYIVPVFKIMIFLMQKK